MYSPLLIAARTSSLFLLEDKLLISCGDSLSGICGSGASLSLKGNTSAGCSGMVSVADWLTWCATGFSISTCQLWINGTELNHSELKVQRLAQGLKAPFTQGWTRCFHDCLLHDVAQVILAPSLLWCFPCSRLHILLPRNVCPSIDSSTQDILAAASVRFALSIVLPNLRLILMADTRYAYAHGLCLLLL